MSSKSAWPIQTEPLNIVVVANYDEKSRRFRAMEIKFALEHPDHPVIKKLHGNDPKFQKLLAEYRAKKAAEAS